MLASPMFKIVHTGIGRDDVRVEADAPLTPEDFRRIASDLIRPVVRARKVGYVAARPGRAGEVIETRWNGRETTNTSHAGDWVVTNLTPEREPLRDREGRLDTYIIAADRFARLYEPVEGKNAFGALYLAREPVEAIRLPGGFDIAAPWGERQRAPTGYLILSGGEVYGNNAETFRATYQPAT
jgi:hypothetical protein